MQKRLVIERVMDADTATKVVELLMQCPDGPTYQIQRGKLDGEVSMLFAADLRLPGDAAP
ncbi:MAG: hypothetical protein IPK85_03170 [Gemmatimonadetes bacterium]|nr:hypothetical protein [Gemmatimonadota bacterium]